MCPGAGGCNVVGDFIGEGGDGIALHFRAEGTFYAADSEDATFEAVFDNAERGYWGTWILNDALLSVRSRDPPNGYADTCSEEPGRYNVTFDDNCQLTALEAVDEPCSKRAGLNTTVEPL